MERRFYGFNNRFRTTKNTEAIVFENGGFVGNLGLVKKLWKKYTEAIYKYRTNTGKMTASGLYSFIWLFKSLLSFCL